MPLDDLNQSLRDHYFGGGPRRGPNHDAISVTTASGQMLLHMRNWFMIPNHSDNASAGAEKQHQSEGYRVAATFDSPAGEHYYGLGQQQQGFLDLRDHQIRCWHDYGAIGGENVCVPFMVSSRGYGLIWDNPSKTTINLGFNQQNVWSSEIGDRVSFFVIAGDKHRRNLRGLSPADRRYAPVAQSGLWLHPEQGNLSHPGSGCWRLQRDIAIVSFRWIFSSSTF